MLRCDAFLRSSPLHTEAAGSAPPEAFGPFRVLHQIGAGALGPVFRAYDPDRERAVAVKLFQTDLPPDRVHQLVDAFERLVAAGLTHPGIAAPVAAGIEGNAAYLAQQLVTGDSLDVLLRDYGPAPPADAVQVAVQLAGALDFAAVVNVTHGALHPRDILLSTEESRITGLGVARAFERIGVAAPVRRPYTAPERIAGGPWDRRADIFSLAAIVHEMLWGRRVQATGLQAGETLTDLAGGDLPALRAAFARALADHPADRFDTALEFAAALRDAFPQVAIRTVHGRQSTVGTRQSRVETLESTVEPATAGVSRPARNAPEPITPERDVERQPADAIAIRSAESTRFQDVEVAPAIVPAETALARDSAARPSPGLFDRHEPIMAASALERSRSAMWPLALALIVGVALGFAAGYGIGNRDRAVAVSVPPPQAPTAAPQPTPTTGREFTDAAVSEPPKPVASSQTDSASAAPEVRATADREVRPNAGAIREPVPVETGRLVVRSTPAGARVFVDGRDRGRTPATVRDLARGTHRVRVMQDGYATEDRRVVVSSSRPAPSVSVALTRTRAEPPARSAARPAARPAVEGFYGALSVDSRPEGAKVFVDGKLIGTTPAALTQVGAGEHVVRIEHDGYRKWSSSVRVVAGERNRVTASLEK